MPYSGDDNLTIMDLTGEGAPQKYNSMLSDYHRLIAARRSVPDYRDLSPMAVRERLDDVRSRLKDAIGFIEYDEHSPPEMHQAGEVEREGYRIRKMWFESRPGWPVTSLLYLPEPLPQKSPAVLAVHGHARADGKLQTTMQKRCIGLVRRGFVVLAVDATGHGERRPSGHENHEIFATGMSPQALLVNDNMRAMDLLQSLEFVDGERVGITGSSGGGNQSMYTAALDERFAASAPTASVCAYEDHLMHSSSDYCPCEVVPGMVQWADIGDFLALIAPRPVLVLSGTRDRTFPVKGARESYLRARDAFAALDAADNIEMWEAYTPHSYSRSMREAMYRFFERRLMGRSEHRPEEHPVAVEPPGEDTLRVLAGTSFPEHQTLDEFVWERARAVLDDPEHPANRVEDAEDLAEYREEFLENRATLFGAPVEEGFQPRVTTRSRRRWGRYSVEAVQAETERGIMVPAAVVTAEGEVAEDRPLVVALSRGGKDDVLWDRPVLRLVDEGFAVVGLDVRGTGETCYVWQGEEDLAALNSVMTGRALFSGRAEDVCGLLAALSAGGIVPPGMPVLLWVRDAFSVYGVLSALLSESVNCFVAENCILSLASPEGLGALKSPGLFVPGILGTADICHLMGLLSHRRLAVVNPAGGNGEPLDGNASAEALQWTKKAYGAMPEAFSIHCGMSSSERDLLVEELAREGGTG